MASPPATASSGIGTAACSWASRLLALLWVNSLALLMSCRPSLTVRWKAVTWTACPTHLCIPLRVWQYLMESSKLIPRLFERPGAKITHSVGLVMMTEWGRPMVALKKSLSSPSFQAYAWSGFWSRSVTTRTDTQYCSRRRAPSATETAECVVKGGLPLNLRRYIEGRTPCSSCCSQEGRRGLRLGSITRHCTGSAWHHRHLTLGSSLDDCNRVGSL